MPGRRAPAVERFFAKVDKTESCWLWRASVCGFGYGKFASGSSRKNHKMEPAHRWLYKLVRGPIPEGYEIDHLCKNKLCVNPAHLEAVTKHENNLRSDSAAGVNFRKVVCKRGHDAFIRRRDGSGRRCPVCDRASALASIERRKAAGTYVHS